MYTSLPWKEEKGIALQRRDADKTGGTHEGVSMERHGRTDKNNECEERVARQETDERDV